tara:strand:- start:227 stop:484 length:258 start_codon:yes stop_codon:yes gene_type:complete
MLIELLLILPFAPLIFFASVGLYFWIKKMANPDFKLYRDIKKMQRRRIKEFQRRIKGKSRAEALSIIFEDYGEMKEEREALKKSK